MHFFGQCDADPPLLPAASAEEQHKLFALCSNPASIAVSLPHQASAGLLCYAVLAAGQEWAGEDCLARTG